MIWHSSDSASVLQTLEVDDKKGLANGVAYMRLEKYGRNDISKIKKPTFLNRFVSQLKSKIVIALMVTAVLSFAVSLIYNEKDFYSPLLIIAIAVINALVSAYHIHNCDNAIEAMKNITNSGATVLRDGIVKAVTSDELVPGDIILLEAGDYISADARIIECSEFRCNESAITGEDIPVEKRSDAVLDDIEPLDKRVNMVYSGSSVVHGSAKAVVVATGLNTEIGHTETIIQQTGEDRLPLEGELDTVGRVVNAAVLIVCAAVFVISMIQNFSSGTFASMTLKMLVNSVALAVAAIPEGLPAIATIVIAIGIQRIMHDSIIIKDAKALELLGKTDVICSDKTGVLTRNKMKLSRIYDGKIITDVENEPVGEVAAMILRLAAACSTLENDSTEYAIANACLAYNSMSEKDIEDMFPRISEIPFDSERKTMTTINMINERPFAIVKGAPEIIVPKCVDCDSEKILKINDELADEALRIVCIAMKPLDTIPANPNPEEIESGLTFVGLLGLIDPPRDESVKDIETCDNAGIKTVMITGDNLITAKAIARRIGILKDGTEAITGAELDEMTDEELAENIEKYTVFARTTPNDKLRIIKALKANKKTVAVTGDSVSDADALAAADVGCAIGRFGADVAKGNADIIITNNRFNSIVAAVRESRGLFANIKKSVHYLLSCNIAELAAMLFGTVIFRAFPLASVQLLWINLLTDCAPAISLSMERGEESVMKKQPCEVGRLFDIKNTVSIAIQAVFIAAMTLISYAVGNKAGHSVAMTMAFVTLGLSQIFHCYNNKSEASIINKNLFSNRLMNFANLLTMFLIVFLVLTPAGFVFSLTVLNASQFFTALLFAFLIVPLCEALKLIYKFTDVR